jgi:hypothetical protein
MQNNAECGRCVPTPICLILFWWHSSAKEHDLRYRIYSSPWEDKMKKLALILLAAASLLGTAGIASAQWYGGGYYGGYYGGRPYYGGPYRHRYYGYDPGYGYPSSPACYYYYGRRICCPGGFTVQDGVCKPYRGY